MKKVLAFRLSHARSLSLSLSIHLVTCPRKGYARRPGCGSTTSSLVRNGKTPVTSWPPPPPRPLFASSEEGTTGPRLASSEKICFCFRFFAQFVELLSVKVECREGEKESWSASPRGERKSEWLAFFFFGSFVSCRASDERAKTAIFCNLFLPLSARSRPFIFSASCAGRAVEFIFSRHVERGHVSREKTGQAIDGKDEKGKKKKKATAAAAPRSLHLSSIPFALLSSPLSLTHTLSSSSSGRSSMTVS